MKSGLIKVVAGLFWLILLMQACKSPELDAILPPPPVPMTTPIDSLKVLAFSLPGIPPENIQIDHEKREIRVILPSDVSTTSFPASITLSPGFNATNTGSNSPYLFDLNLTKRPVEFYIPNNRYGETAGKPYTVVSLAGGPLEITNPPASLTLETGNLLPITVKNYYDDAVFNNVAVLTNQLTGQQYTGIIMSCYDLIGGCQGTTAGTIYANFDANIAYGKYDLEIRKTNQRQTRASGPLVVSKGLPYAIYYDLYNPPAPGVQNLAMSGYNLFKEDQIQLLLKNRTGESYTLTPTTYADDGKSLTVDLPTAIKPSQYSIQMVRKGQPVASYSRIIIIRDRSEPAFISIGNRSFNQDPDMPITLERGKQQYFTFVIGSNISKVQLKLIPVIANLPLVLVDVNTPKDYLRFGPDGGTPSFSIPATTPAGKYLIVLQNILYDNKLVEGQPFERLIELQ